jgi:hypothetical protein
MALLLLAPALLAVAGACGGGGLPPAAPTSTVPGEGIVTGAGTGSQVLVPGSGIYFTPEVTSASTQAGTPTPTPPPLTLGEELTSVLVDTLSMEEYPRIPARTLESNLRDNPAGVPSYIGRSFVIQGDVREAGRDASGAPYVTFKAGAGAVTCWFEKISEAELRRLTPDGRTVVTGKLASWDAENRVLAVQSCRLVRGY